MLNTFYELNVLCEFPPNQNWELLYRATRDGFDAKDFHRICDHKRNTLTVIKSTHGNIFGGYNDEAWDSTNRYYDDSNAFLYSLVNKDNKSFKVNIPKNSICCNSSYGPSFGIGHDICISSNSNINSESFSFFGLSTKLKSIFAGSYKFQTVEIEVFNKI